MKRTTTARSAEPSWLQKSLPPADTIAHFTLSAIKGFADDCLRLKLEPFFQSSIAPEKLQLFEKKKEAYREQGLAYAW